MNKPTLILLAAISSASLTFAAHAGDGHRSPGKPMGALQVRAPDQPKPLAVGASERITLTLQTAQASEVQMELFAPDGLRARAVSPARLMLAAGQDTPLLLDVAAEREGHFLLRILLRTRINGETQARSVALPFSTPQADKFAQKKPLIEKIDASGRKIIEWPAR